MSTACVSWKFTFSNQLECTPIVFMEFRLDLVFLPCDMNKVHAVSSLAIYGMTNLCDMNVVISVTALLACRALYHVVNMLHAQI